MTRARMVLDRSLYDYECKVCKTWTPSTGSCHGCGVPAVVGNQVTRRPAHFPAAWMITLAHNHAVGCALVASFRAGDNFGFHMGSDMDGLSQCVCQWHPGTGEPYRGTTRCDQDLAHEDDDPDDHFGELDV